MILDFSISPTEEFNEVAFEFEQNISTCIWTSRCGEILKSRDYFSARQIPPGGQYIFMAQNITGQILE